ncbi:hypothetical protein L1887_54817 [Cichorium endivia]|nr:hypothetical protein L1887_54817 [Cichorium endivia]
MSRPLFAVPITVRLGADEQAEDEKQREAAYSTARRLDDRPFLVLEFYETTQKVVLHECRSNAAPHSAGNEAAEEGAKAHDGDRRVCQAAAVGELRLCSLACSESARRASQPLARVAMEAFGDAVGRRWRRACACMTTSRRRQLFSRSDAAMPYCQPWPSRSRSTVHSIQPAHAEGTSGNRDRHSLRTRTTGLCVRRFRRPCRRQCSQLGRVRASRGIYGASSGLHVLLGVGCAREASLLLFLACIAVWAPYQQSHRSFHSQRKLSRDPSAGDPLCDGGLVGRFVGPGAMMGIGVTWRGTEFNRRRWRSAVEFTLSPSKSSSWFHPHPPSAPPPPVSLFFSPSGNGRSMARSRASQPSQPSPTTCRPTFATLASLATLPPPALRC